MLEEGIVPVDTRLAPGKKLASKALPFPVLRGRLTKGTRDDHVMHLSTIPYNATCVHPPAVHESIISASIIAIPLMTRTVQS